MKGLLHNTEIGWMVVYDQRTWQDPSAEDGEIALHLHPDEVKMNSVYFNELLKDGQEVDFEIIVDEKLNKFAKLCQTNNKTAFPAVLICDCSSREHQIIIEHDNEDNLTYCHIHLVKHGFWRRLKAGLKYIFGYKCRYGQWDEFILKPEHANQLRELSDLLSQKVIRK